MEKYNFDTCIQKIIYIYKLERKEEILVYVPNILMYLDAHISRYANYCEICYF